MARHQPKEHLGTEGVLSQLNGVRKTGDGWTARCPAHGDKNASLTVSRGDKGGTVLNCHAGCSFADICAALGVEQQQLMPPAEPPGRPSSKKTNTWRRKAEALARDFSPERRAELAQALSLPAWAFDALPLLGSGSDQGGEFWSFAEYDPAGEVIGISRRYVDGSKKAMQGSKRGLTLPALWRERPGPLFIVEGASDCVALSAAGVVVVGRPGASSGAQALGELFADWPADRAIITIGENDQKPDGHWPGRDGASTVAVELASRLARRIGVVMPPEGFKDSRAWLTSKVDVQASREEWASAGQDLLSAWLGQDLALVQWVDPSSVPAADKRRDRPTVLLDPSDLACTVDQLAEVLAGSPDVFTMNGQLAWVCAVPRHDADNRLSVGRQTQLLSREVAGYLLSQESDFQKPGRNGNMVRCAPPEQAVGTLLKLPHVCRFRPLRGVLPCPMLLPDGRLVSKDGYDAATGWFVSTEGLNLPTIPEKPTRNQALAAVGQLLDLVEEFPWPGKADQAVWLSYALTLCCRSSFTGSTPLFLFTAPTAGSGKSLLVRLATSIAFGQDPGLRNLPCDEFRSELQVDQTELRKAITSIALSGSPAEVFDDIPQGLSIGGAALNNVLTSAVWKDRRLGASEDVGMPWTCVLAATGNNVSVASDTTRRVVQCRIEPEMERPAERGDYRIKDLLAHTRANRPELLAAALTIVRGYIAAGKPHQKITNFGSFEQWSDTIRSAVHWLMGTDPLATRTSIQTVEDLDEVAELLAALAEIPGIHQGLPSRQIIATLKAAAGSDSLEAARSILATWARSGEAFPNEQSLGMRLNGLKDRVAGGLRLKSRKESTGAKVWRIETVSGQAGPERHASNPPSGELPDFPELADGYEVFSA